MRNSAAGFFLRMLLVVGLAILVWTLIQGAWLTMIGNMLSASQSSGLPVSGTPAGAFSFPTSEPSAPIGTERITGDLAITVTRVLRPADQPIYAAYYKTLGQGDEFIAVGVQARCIAPDKSCRLTEFDFGINSESGKDYMAEFTTSFTGVKGLFEGGEIEPGQSRSGDLVFIVPKDATGLLLIYPRLYSFGSGARFRLWP